MMIDLVVDGARRIAVPVGASAKGTSLTRVLALKSSPGWLVEGNVVREWRFEGMTERDGTVYLYGPPLAGTSFEEVLALPLAKALPALSALAQSLCLLSERSIPRFPLQTDSVFFTDAGEVLFFPPAVFHEIRDLSTFARNRDCFEAINHPDLKGDALASFSIAAALYRVTTGRFPFTGADAEELHEQARKLEIASPADVVPELSPAVSAAVMAGLGRAHGESVTLAQWADSLAAWQKQELYRTLGAAEKEKTLREAGARQEGSVKSFRRRLFWEKNWRVALIVAVIVIAVGGVLGSILKNVLAPRPTHGFPPQKVVETFYESMNALDHMTMQACVVGGAGKGEINEATTLFVTSRVTQGYEGKSNVLSAEDWDKKGRPPLASPTTIYGVTGLVVTREQGEPNPVYLVKYDKWNPAASSDSAPSLDMVAAPHSEGHAVTERVWMKQDHGDWVIFKIDRLGATPLPTPALAPTLPAPGANPKQ
jgi:hypothetical protein